MTATLLALLVSTTLPTQRAASPAASSSAVATAVLRNCYVTQIEQVQVSAQEAGVLTNVEVQEGNPVEAGQLLAQIAFTRGAISA